MTICNDTELLKNLFTQGLTVDEIAAKTNRSKNGVYNRLKRIGLSFRTRGHEIRLAEAKRAAEKKNDVNDPIPCLRCRVPFKSEGKHNRICGQCSNFNSGYLGVVYD